MLKQAPSLHDPSLFAPASQSGAHRTPEAERRTSGMVTLATILLMGVASIGLSACDSEGTGADDGTPPAVNDTTTTQ